jgi:hypothetical protein
MKLLLQQAVHWQVKNVGYYVPLLLSWVHAQCH